MAYRNTIRKFTKFYQDKLMNNEPSFRKKFIPGDPGPHHNPWIIDIKKAERDAAKSGGAFWFLLMLFAAFFVPLAACKFDLKCKPFPSEEVRFQNIQRMLISRK